MLYFGLRRCASTLSSRFQSGFGGVPMCSILPQLSVMGATPSPAPLAATARRSYASDPPPPSPSDVIKEHSIESMWTMWNEGNLFSISAPELALFLTKQRVPVDTNRAKKTVLVKHVEEYLQAREDEAKGKPKRDSESGGDSANAIAFGSWDKKAAQTRMTETLMDLNQAGFYEEGSSTLAPRAFQLLVDKGCPDLVVSRVNTTAFPGFPASCECYTLTPAQSDQASLVRYNKTLQWCVLNMKNLSLSGEIYIEFGKLLLLPTVLKKKSSIIPAWTLQQRLQLANPTHWVGCASTTSTAGVEKLMAELGFVPQSKQPTTYDCIIRRKGAGAHLILSSTGATQSVHRTWEHLQRSHVSREKGVDIRFLTRARATAKKEDVEAFTRTPIADVKADPVKSLLPSHFGEISYLSENETRVWTKRGATSNVNLSVLEVKRDPLMISQDEDAGYRLEYALRVAIPEREHVDLNLLGNDVYKLAWQIADSLDDGFVSEFKPTLSQLNVHQMMQQSHSDTTNDATTTTTPLVE